MQEIQINEIINKAKEVSSQEKKWHFHLLGKNCEFNENKGKFLLVLEAENNVFYSCFDEKPLREAKILADLLYGKKFLEKSEKEKQTESKPEFNKILEKARELTEKRIEWHHHHLPSKCAFNKYKGKHCIVFENKTETLTAVYSEKPMKDLIKIEKLFYKELV